MIDTGLGYTQFQVPLPTHRRRCSTRKILVSRSQVKDRDDWFDDVSPPDLRIDLFDGAFGGSHGWFTFREIA